MNYLYLHGFASSPQSYKAQYMQRKFIELGLTLHVPDLNLNDFTTVTLSEQLAYLDRTYLNNQEQSIVIGSSLGGFLAVQLAARNPSVQKLILFAPAFGFSQRIAQNLGTENISKWQELVERLQKNGSNLPVIAGILPVTNLKQLSRMVELSGTKIPVEILNRFESVKNDPVSVKKIGIDIATQMGAQLLDLGVPGLHFYTMNTAESTIEIAKNLGLVKS